MEKREKSYYELIVNTYKRKVVMIALIAYVVLFILTGFINMYISMILFIALAYYLTLHIIVAAMKKSTFIELLGGVAIYNEVEKNYQNSLYEDKDVIMGESYILKKRPALKLKNKRAQFIMNLNDVSWIYQTITQHRTNGIPTGKTYIINLRGYNGDFEINQRKNENLDIVNVIGQQSNNFIFGFSQERLLSFNSSSTVGEFFGKVAAIEGWNKQENETSTNTQN